MSRVKENMEKNFYNPAEVADILNVSYATALDWIKHSGIPYIKVGRSYRVSTQVFDKFTSGVTNEH